MRIGILGSGLMGAKLGTIFARAGHEVVFSYARSEQKLKRLAREAGGKARAGTPREAARGRAGRGCVIAGRALAAVRRRPETGGRPVGQARRDLLAADERGQHRARRGPYLVGRGGAGEKHSQSSRRGGIRDRPERSVLRRL